MGVGPSPGVASAVMTDGPTPGNAGSGESGLHDTTRYETLVGISFDDLFRAQEFVTATSRLAATGGLTLKDVVIVMKSPEGKTVVRETRDLQPGRSALSGGFWAGLVGLMLGGPVGWLAGAALGAGAGAVTAKVVDVGIPDAWVSWFRDAVQPGTATVAILATDIDHNALVTEAGRFTGAELVYANLDPATLERLHQVLANVGLADSDQPDNHADEQAGAAEPRRAPPAPPSASDDPSAAAQPVRPPTERPAD